MYKVKGITLSELDTIVSIHNNAFPGFFLTQLGNSFLKTYYRAVLKHYDGILLGCYDEDRLVGFCAATMLASGFNVRLIKSDWPSFMRVGTFLFLTNMSSIKRLYLNLSKRDSGYADTGEYAELLSIGVDFSYQGKGIGKQLLTELEKSVYGKGGVKLSLTTDFYNNQKTIGFYQTMGYRPLYDFIAYPDRKMYRMIKSLT